MSDMEKLLGRLDEVDSGLKDYTKSHKAEIDEVRQGTKAVEKLVAEQQKQLQEFAVLAKRGIGSDARDEMALVGKAAINGALGKAASEGTDADGGYLVEEEWVKVIKSAQNQYGLARQVFGDMVYPMMSDVAYVPVDSYEETSGNVPVPASTSENGQISESDVAQLAQITLTAGKYATLSYISNELLDDAFVDYVGAYLTPKLARQAAKIEDTVVFTKASTGLLNTSNIQEVVLDSGDTSFTDVSFEKILDMQDAVVSDALAGGEYILHRSMVNQLRKLKGADDYYWTPAAAGEPASICGYGYKKGEIMPARSGSDADKSFALFGDIKLGSVFGERLGRKIVSSRDFRFDYDQTALRMTFRIAFGTNANCGRAICKLTTAAS